MLATSGMQLRARHVRRNLHIEYTSIRRDRDVAAALTPGKHDPEEEDGYEQNDDLGHGENSGLFTGTLCASTARCRDILRSH